MLVQVIESQNSVVFLRHSVWNLLKASYRYFSVTYLNESQHLHLPARNMLKSYVYVWMHEKNDAVETAFKLHCVSKNVPPLNCL